MTITKEQLNRVRLTPHFTIGEFFKHSLLQNLAFSFFFVTLQQNLDGHLCYKIRKDFHS